QIQINASSARPDAASFITNLFHSPRSNIARGKVAIARVLSFQKIIALLFGNLRQRTVIGFLLGHPDASVIAKRFGHEGQFGLILAADRDARGMDLSEAGIGKSCALL